MTDRKAPVDSIRVRMYRQGFGDCFLLQFFAGEERVFNMLIDCGIKLGTSRVDCPIEAVMDDLRQQLTPPGKKKPRLDVLVATHEHWDHIAFFHPRTSTQTGSTQKDLFADFEIDQVWLGWTEDPHDKDAKALNARLRQGAAALQVAAAHLHAKKSVSDPEYETRLSGPEDEQDPRTAFNLGVTRIAEFYGSEAGHGVKLSAAKGRRSLKTEEALKNIIEIGKKHGEICYFQPGTLLDSRPVPPGVRIYVLGPPKGALLKKSNPSAGRAQETYLSIDNAGFGAFVDGLLGLGDDATTAATPLAGSPFATRASLDMAKAEKHPYLRQTYFQNDEKHRRIDDTWLDATGQFALQLDGAVNNTSLVLAIEFIESGKVLLFPGDAQVGSWLSWHDLTWKVRSGTSTETRTATDLLNNTVLYKVSHHGSHNATIKDKGLELMTHPELVALIPEQEESYSGILHKELFQRLQQRCRGRVIVSADENHPAENMQTRKPEGLSQSEWASFKNRLKVTKTYIEYTVSK